ncbi:hypothetical protein EGW08_020354 [Elysia chlorotica]|uniref:Uncharacterized protein n=1 Tax=Elysia chlorotica TaxID=188477 RepID=A0A433SRJ8_ELYCH|nr:hypothetical protein EGW08_020354 [Elysia chlorotica]
MSGEAESVADNHQTYDYPFGRGNIQYDNDNNNNNNNGNTAGRRSSTTYTQHQRRRYHSSSGASSEQAGRSSQAAEHGSEHESRSNQGGGFENTGSSQGRTYSAGTSGSGQVYNTYHLSGPDSTSSQGRDTRYISRTRYIRPGYGPDVRQRSLYGTADGQIYYGSADGQRNVYGNTDGQRDRYDGTGRSQTTGGRTSTYSHGASRDGSQGYRHGYTPNRLTSRDERDECPQSGVELRIDGLPCDQAVRRFGLALCYSHEFSSRRCCQACRPRRNQDKPGCEYGDRSTRCDAIRRNPGLCYNAENQRVCCESCALLRDQRKPDCPWGDHNAQLCRPFETNSTNVRINCYSPRTRNLCCNSCERLRQWVPDNLPAGCEYGDQPVQFLAGQFGQLTCSSYFHHFSVQHCTLPDSDVARYRLPGHRSSWMYRLPGHRS